MAYLFGKKKKKEEVEEEEEEGKGEETSERKYINEITLRYMYKEEEQKNNFDNNSNS